MTRSLERGFDLIMEWWSRDATQRGFATLLIACFVGTAAVVELARRGLLPQGVLTRAIPPNHFFALEVAFTLLLLGEIVTLVLGMARSMAEAVGHQFEVLALILIRQSFEEFRHLHEPIDWHQVASAVPRILSDAFGALLIFILVGVFIRLQRHRPISDDPSDNASFVRSKKMIALVLLAALLFLCTDNVRLFFEGSAPLPLFEVFYTLLIFADVLVVLLSMRLSTRFPVVFRYFGYAVATVLVRLALTAPRFIDAGLGAASALFAILLTWAYNTVAERDEAGAHQ